MNSPLAQIDPKGIKKLLIIRPRFIGDVLLSTSLVRALKTGFPRIKISYLAEKTSLEVLKNNPYIDELITLERGSLADDLLMIRNIRNRKFSAVIDTFGNPRSALLAFFSGAKYRIGWEHRGRKYAYTHFVGRGAEKPGVRQDRRDIAEQDPWLREIGDVTDGCSEL